MNKSTGKNKLEVKIETLFKAVSKTNPQQNYALISVKGELAKQVIKRKKTDVVLAVDCSSSMSNCILEAKEAAKQVILALEASDRLGIVAFDSNVKVIQPLTLVEDKEALIAAIDTLRADGSTALFGGWEKSRELFKSKDNFQRIILISDGGANIGETNPDVICETVLNATSQGITTTCVGLGKHFNEDLLQGMAVDGEGNYFFAEDPHKMIGFFKADISGAKATIGTNTSVTFQITEGVDIVKVFSPHVLKENSISLGNLQAGIERSVLIQFLTPASEKDLTPFSVQVKTTTEDGTEEISQTLVLTSTDTEWVSLGENPKVKEQVAIAEAAEKRQEAIKVYESGNRAGGLAIFAQAAATLDSLPESDLLASEKTLYSFVGEKLKSMDVLSAVKMSKVMDYTRDNTTVRNATASIYKKKDIKS